MWWTRPRTDRSGPDAASTAGHGGAGGHRHGPDPRTDPRRLSAALALICAFMAAEVTVGVAAHSLALLSDAAHMLTDAGALMLVLVTGRLATRPPRGGFTYGLKRAEILSAQANGVTLVALGGALGYEAIVRLVHPPPVAGGPMVAVAAAGVAVNLAATVLVGGADRGRLNVEGAYRHILTDLYAFLATAAAGVAILLTGFTRADAAASLLVVVLMVAAGVGLIVRSGRIFLEAAPVGLSPTAVGTAMAGRPHVTEVHDLHIWEITSGMPAASAHVLVAAGQDCHAVRADLEAFLSREYGITHTTLQVDHAPDPLLTIGHRPPVSDPAGDAPHGGHHPDPRDGGGATGRSSPGWSGTCR